LIDRVYVRTQYFEGWATVLGYFPNEVYPLQIELDEPDADGHAIKRITKSEIIRKE
jgi:hypothetical protein